MINTVSILFGLVGLVLVVARAVVMDRTRPWFETAPLRPREKKKEVRIR